MRPKFNHIKCKFDKQKISLAFREDLNMPFSTYTNNVSSLYLNSVSKKGTV